MRRRVRIISIPNEKPLPPMRAFFIRGRNILFLILSGAYFEEGIYPPPLVCSARPCLYIYIVFIHLKYICLGLEIT
jgi:hypothetical protein